MYQDRIMNPDEHTVRVSLSSVSFNKLDLAAIYAGGGREDF